MVSLDKFALARMCLGYADLYMMLGDTRRENAYIAGGYSLTTLLLSVYTSGNMHSFTHLKNIGAGINDRLRTYIQTGKYPQDFFDLKKKVETLEAQQPDVPVEDTNESNWDAIVKAAVSAPGVATITVTYTDGLSVSLVRK